MEVQEVQEVLATLLTPAAQVALIIALAQLIKEVGFPAKFIPVVDLVLGIVLGLSACGLFSGIKNIKEGTE